jgi:hypothetical protein
MELRCFSVMRTHLIPQQKREEMGTTDVTSAIHMVISLTPLKVLFSDREDLGRRGPPADIPAESRPEASSRHL